MDIVFQAHAAVFGVDAGLDGKHGSRKQAAVVMGFKIVQICTDTVAVMPNIMASSMHDA